MADFPLCDAFLGEYAGFDETQPTAESGGKGQVISYLKEQFQFKKVVMIGDGATDMEACPPAVSFCGLPDYSSVPLFRTLLFYSLTGVHRLLDSRGGRADVPGFISPNP